MNSIDPFGGTGSASRAGPLDNGGSLFIYRGVRQRTRPIVFHSSKCLLIPPTADRSVNIGVEPRDDRRESALVTSR